MNAGKSIFVAGAFAVGMTAAAGTASAATMIATNGTPLTYMIHDMGGADSTTMVLDTNPGGYLVDYTSSSTLHDVGGGFAQVTGVGGDGSKGLGFADLTITPQSPLAGMTAIKFNLDNAPSASPGGPAGYTLIDLTFETTVNFVGGGSQTFTTDIGKGNGDNRYLVTAGVGQLISSIEFSDLDATFTKKNHPNISQDLNFNSIKQVSFDAELSAVPEPASWAMMIVGIGAAGAMLRRRRGLAEVA